MDPDTPLFLIAGHTVTLFEAALAGAAIFALLIVLLVIRNRISADRRRSENLAEEASAQTRRLEEEIATLSRSQAEMTARLQTVAEIFGSRQSDLNRAMSERMDNLGHRLGQSMTQSTTNTQASLQKLNERLAVIDRAQKSMMDLTGQVVELQSILKNKQTRGAFGQGRMEAIITDGLPENAFSFQATLSNGNRPDCLVSFPNDAPPLVIDAKFPLEAYQLLKDAQTPEEIKAAKAQFRRDMTKHISDISEKYLLPGETQDTAFLFVPSETIFATVHERFEDVVQKAYRARVVIVSPSLLHLSIQVVQALLRDARIREEAHVIQAEVAHLLTDVSRLDERVAKLKSHFAQAEKDIDQIEISSKKISSRGNRIDALQLGERIRDDGGTGGEALRIAGE